MTQMTAEYERTVFETTPRFGAGELPVAYTPLNRHTLEPSEHFGPLQFHVSASSHQHHIEFLTNCRPDSLHPANTENLFPFEFWPLPRVMSRWRFGRLNEVISVKAKRNIKLRPKPDENLYGETLAKTVSYRNGLCFATLNSRTIKETGEICMEAEDVLLLANGCDPERLRRAIQQNIRNKTVVPQLSIIQYLSSWRLLMRHDWPQDKWLNNVHTKNYARSLGYFDALVEGPGIADVIFSCDRVSSTPAKSFVLSWKYTAPLYDNLLVSLVRESLAQSDSRRYYLCEGGGCDTDHAVVMQMEIN